MRYVHFLYCFPLNEINTFIQLGCIKLFKSVSKHYIIKNILNKCSHFELYSKKKENNKNILFI